MEGKDGTCHKLSGTTVPDKEEEIAFIEMRECSNCGKKCSDGENIFAGYSCSKFCRLQLISNNLERYRVTSLKKRDDPMFSLINLKPLNSLPVCNKIYDTFFCSGFKNTESLATTTTSRRGSIHFLTLSPLILPLTSLQMGL